MLCNNLSLKYFINEALMIVSKFLGITYPSELKSAFQLILLFLHPPNRRQLHLLLRVVNKILKNQKFILDVKMPMRDYVSNN